MCKIDDYGGKMGVETPIFLNGLILWGIIGAIVENDFVKAS